MKFDRDPEIALLLSKFKNLRVMHLKLEEVIKKLCEAANPSAEGKIITLIGPTGTGKSTLLGYMEAIINKHYLEEMELNPSFVPVINLSLQPGLGGSFNWKDGFIRVLEALGEPLIRRKVTSRYHIELDGEILTHFSKLVAYELRRAVKSTTAARETKYILMDEASSLFKSSGDDYLLQFDLMKSFAEEIKARIVLGGAYDLLKIEEYHAQLIRRMRAIHFDSYHHEELHIGNMYGNSFRDAVATLLEAMPVPKEKGLVDHADYFLMKTVGGIGNLKDWLLYALDAALASPKQILTRKILQDTEFPNRHLQKMFNEAKLGRAKMKEISDEDLSRSMGFKEKPTLKPKQNAEQNSDTDGSSPTPKGNRKPGKRNPKRDQVGGEQDV